MMVSNSFDVVVLGAGPAGLATAIKASKLGLTVGIVTKRCSPQPGYGESLAPAANRILKELGLWEQFVTGSHEVCPGYAWSWESEKLSFHSFTTDPRGHGWHINRPQFELLLINTCNSLNICIHKTIGLPNIQREHTHWALRFNKQYWTARSIVDATGHSNVLSKALGIKRHCFDVQQATIVFLNTQGGPGIKDLSTLVEASSDGWWYSSRLPDERLAIAFFRDTQRFNQQLFIDQLYATRWTKNRLLEGTYNTAKLSKKDFRHVVVRSSVLLNPSKPSYRAVGDAALTYDPLASHGLTFALLSGIDAARSLYAELGGDTTSINNYAEKIFNAAEKYLMLRSNIYKAQVRFSDSTFWKQRQQ